MSTNSKDEIKKPLTKFEPEKEYKIERYDLSADKSLKPSSAADEYLLKSIQTLEKHPNHLGIYNDRFGFLGCHLHASNPTLVLTQKSQEKAIIANLNANNIPLLNFSNPLAPFNKKLDIGLIKIPKSLALFQLFLEQIANHSTEEVTVFAAFMTRHFSPKLLQIASEYFEVVEQSRAVKKARVLTLKQKKAIFKKEIITSLNYQNQVYQQYWGVFSADHIDYATQFFLEHLAVKQTDQVILDLAAGNGIIGHQIAQQRPDAEIHLIDDAYLAVASAKLNVHGKNIHHHFNNDLSIFEENTFDLIVSNPPFHFEYEVNIQTPIHLLRAAFHCLKTGGNLQLVANRHLNYKVHLAPLFSSVEVIAENKKFIVYKCTK